jgi:hypothetical protein
MDNVEPDAIVFDIKNNRHKLCRYEKVKRFDKELELKFQK